MGVFVLACFAIAYGWILHTAIERSVYKITGIHFLDSFVLPWFLGPFAAIPPFTFYVAFGFNELAATPDGVKLQDRLHWAGRLQTVYLVLYGLFVLATVPQK